ncbi:MAG: hypothetical protein R2795_16335 [Saprospiraceae bacterium]
MGSLIFFPSLSKLLYKTVLLSIGMLLLGCSPTDPMDAQTPSSLREPFFDFFNAIRREVHTLEEEYPRIAGFGTETKAFLENRESQALYKIAGFYFERNLNREQGAYNYADRFFDDGCVIHCIVYPPEQVVVWQNLQGYNKGKGKQVGVNFVYYQVFTAHPEDIALENRIGHIIEQKMEEYAATIGQPMQ